MSPERFEHLLRLVAPYITKKPCRFRDPIPPAERLMSTLRYMASRESQQSISLSFRMGRKTVSRVVRECTVGIWDALHEEYLSPPETTQNWQDVAQEFEKEWNFPHCSGAIDGKYVRMECPKNAVSAFYNYKGYHSLVLLAVCDAKYCFTLVDTGAYGGDNDANILANSKFGEAFDRNPTSLNLPKLDLVGDVMLPYVLTGDSIFPLKSWLIKPFSGKICEEKRVFNYRLSRARGTIENAFGILAAKWRIFNTPIKASIELTENITRAAVCLHNYIRLTDNASYIPTGFVDSEDHCGDIIPGD